MLFCASVKVSEKSHVYFFYLLPTHTGGVGENPQEDAKAETSVFETPTLPVYFTDQEATRR